jgi:hypothetical protein
MESSLSFLNFFPLHALSEKPKPHITPMPGNPVAGRLDIVGSTLFSYVYSVVGDDSKTVLKARELWCEGK